MDSSSRASRKRQSRTATQVIAAIPPLPEFAPLLHAQSLHQAVVTIPPYIDSGDAYTLFTLFITEKHFIDIATNTNSYARSHEAGKLGKRSWRDTLASEIKVFIRI